MSGNGFNRSRSIVELNALAVADRGGAEKDDFLFQSGRWVVRPPTQ